MEEITTKPMGCGAALFYVVGGTLVLLTIIGAALIQFAG